MAITKIWPIKHTLKNSLDYIMDKEKTQENLLVSSFGVQPETADFEFNMTANLAEAMHGNRSKIGGANVLAYHMIQSFSIKDNLTPEQAHELGKQWADRLLQGQHEYVVTTHVDKDHIHNHVIFNSVSCESYNKFRSQPFKTVQKIRDISDNLCQEHGLFVLENAVGRGLKKGELYAKKKGKSWKDKIEKTIDSIIPQVANYQEFIESLQGAGINVKEGKYLSYSIDGKPKTSVRANGRGLSFDYSREGIIARINKELRKDLHLVTLNTKLVETGNTTYFTRIPYTKNYVRYDKDSSFWHKNNLTLGVYITANKDYEICNRQGTVIKTVKGHELLGYYEDKSRKEITVQETVKDGTVKVSGLLEQYIGIKLPFDRRAAFIARKQGLESIKKMSFALQVMRNENIANYKDFDKKNEALQRTAEAINTTKYLPLEEKQQTLKEVAGLIVTYNKYKLIADKVSSASVFRVAKLKNTYSAELAAFEYAKASIEAKGLDPATNHEDLLSAIKQIQTSKLEVKNDMKEIQSRKQNISKAKANIESILETKGRSRSREVIKSNSKKKNIAL